MAVNFIRETFNPGEVDFPITVENGDVLWFDANLLWRHSVNYPTERRRVVELVESFAYLIKAWDRYPEQEHQLKRVEQADLTYPIIAHANPKYGLLDGAHRLYKAFTQGVEYIDIIYLQDFPKPFMRFNKAGQCI